MKTVTSSKIAVIALAAVLITAAQGTIFSAQVSATEQKSDFSIGISPSKMAIDLTPGETFDGEYTVFNNGLNAYDFRAFATPYSRVGEDYENDFITETNFNKLANWISLEQDTFHLTPGEEVVVRFSIDVPNSAAGGQYAALINRIEDDASDGGVIAIKQVGLTITSKIDGELNYCGEVISAHVPMWQWSSPITASATISNCGNIDFRPRVVYEVQSLFGQTVYSSMNSEAESFLMPETEHGFKAKWDNPEWKNQPIIGIYKVKQTIQFLTQDTTREYLIILCPPWLLIVALLAVIGIVISIVLKVKQPKRGRRQL